MGGGIRTGLHLLGIEGVLPPPTHSPVSVAMTSMLPRHACPTCQLVQLVTKRPAWRVRFVLWMESQTESP